MFSLTEVLQGRTQPHLVSLRGLTALKSFHPHDGTESLSPRIERDKQLATEPSLPLPVDCLSAPLLHPLLTAILHTLSFRLRSTMSANSVDSSASKPGDPLSIWYEQYMALDGNLISSDHAVIQDLKSDELDYDQIELEVQHLIPSADVLDGFCGKCRWLLGHWPDISEEVIGDESDWACALGRAVHTLEIEAAAKAGCKFCLFFLSGLMRASQLDTIRKIEERFKLLGEVGTSTITIQNWGKDDSQLLWLNLPGKTATSCNASGARMSGCKTVSERMSSICKPHVVGMPLSIQILTP